MREIDKYIVMDIYLQPNNATFHIKFNYRCHKIQQVCIVTHVNKLL
jgi:hypothetical protein